MTICPICGHKNIPGALACANCFAIFNKAGQTTSTTQVPSDIQFSPSPMAVNTHDLSKLRPDVIVFYIENRSEPVKLQIAAQAILGRYSTNANNAQPLIDLTPYGAFEKGISRAHAIIRRDVSNKLTIEDMASSNGTWLNGTRLQPYLASVIRSGSRLKLAQFEMQIYFNEAARSVEVGA